jgi:small subunit ribosomal protein S2
LAVANYNYSIKSLLEVGAHFGHQSVYWNPKMANYVFMKRKDIHIIDLQKTILYLEKACNQLKNISAQGSKILFVGTKKQVKEIVKMKTLDSGHYHITHRWIGGMLTNYKVVSKSIEKIKKYDLILGDEEKQKEYTKNNLVKIKKKRDKLFKIYSGVLEMKKLPDALFIVDVFRERKAALEAKNLNIPVFSIVDTNGDPDLVDVIIPGNDDAIRSVSLFLDYVMNAIREGDIIYKRNRLEDDLFAEQILKEEKLKKEKEKTEMLVSQKPEEEPEKESNKKPEKELKSEINKDEIPKFFKPKFIKTTAPKYPQAVKVKKNDININIKADDVKELRELTNVGMMECKKALVKAQGNKKEAIKILKEHGLAVAEKRSDRVVNEGAIFINCQEHKAWMFSLCCETDFVANSKAFNDFLNNIGEKFVNDSSYLESVEFNNILIDTINKIGEKLLLENFVHQKNDQNNFFSYLHNNHKVGVLLSLESENKQIFNDEKVKNLGKNLCLQIAAMNPISISMDEISNEILEEQKALFLKQMANEQKPENIKNKIVEGKIKKYFSEKCLLDMEFVKENNKSVREYIQEVSQAVGANITICNFKRNQIG